MILLKSENTPLASGKITEDEGSWIVSMITIGALIGNFFFAYITNKFGRKWPLIAMAIPNIVWISILSRINSPHIKIFSPNIRLHSDKLDSHLVCSECLLFVCSETTERSCWRRVLRYNAALFEWDSEWSVLIYFVILNSVEMKITTNYQFISGFEAKWDQQLFCHVIQEF